MTIGKRIKNKREELGIPQVELAKKIGCSKQTLYKYENDIITNIPSDNIEKIAYMLEITPAYLMGWEDEIKKSPELDVEVKQWELEGEFLEKFSKLSEGNKKVVMDLVDSLLKNQN